MFVKAIECYSGFSPVNGIGMVRRNKWFFKFFLRAYSNNILFLRLEVSFLPGDSTTSKVLDLFFCVYD